MIRNIVSSMWHNKLRVLLILFLATITSFLVLLTLTNSFSFHTQILIVEDMFSSSLDHTYRVDVSYIEDFETSGIAFSKWKEFINQQEDTVCGAYDESGEYFEELQNNQEYISLNQKSYTKTFRESTPTISEVVFFDTKILSLMSVDLSEEDFLPIEQNGKTYLPLYVGKDFENVFSVGDILTLSRNKTEYMIQGILPDQKSKNHVCISKLCLNGKIHSLSTTHHLKVVGL